MNRIVLIGNGFDLAHGLKTSYQDFINWYWEQRVHAIWTDVDTSSKDCLCELKLNEGANFSSWYSYFITHQIQLQDMDGWSIIQSMLRHQVIKQIPTPFFEAITTSIETKGWVDIENEYYAQLKGLILHSDYKNFYKIIKVKELNAQLSFIQEMLIEFLKSKTMPQKTDDALEHLLYEPIREKEIAVSRMSDFHNHIDDWIWADDNSWELRYEQYGRGNSVFAYKGTTKYDINRIKSEVSAKQLNDNDAQKERVRLALEHDRLPELQWPNNILFVNFNYTPLAKLYVKPNHDEFQYVTIHGNLTDAKSIIFGYGDDLDDEYKEIQSQNENVYMDNFKTNMYMESDNYRKVLQFAELEPYQIYIVGLSCGTSDRTLLNTLFEHPNCVSIKPFFYKKSKDLDTFRELQMNIARNFTDSKKMRERVVNKVNTTVYCDNSKGGKYN